MSSDTDPEPCNKKRKTGIDVNLHEYFDIKFKENLNLLLTGDGESFSATHRNKFTFDRQPQLDDNTHEAYSHFSQIHPDTLSDDYTFQNKTTDLPAVAKAIWRQARTASIDAAKLRECYQWYNEAIARSLFEPWTAVLEKTPPFVNRRELLTRIATIPRAAAMQVMQATAAFLNEEATRLGGMAAGHLTTIERMVIQAFPNDPDCARTVYDRAEAAVTSTADRERNKEFKSLETRSQTLSLQHPPDHHVADPLSVTQRQRPSATRQDDQSPFSGRPAYGGRRGRGRRPGRRARRDCQT